MMDYKYGESLMRIENISMSYGDKLVLRDVTTEIKNIVTCNNVGQVVGFLGPSGIGKSTLFNIMAGLLKPTGGQVSILDSKTPVKPGEVGVLAQNYPLFNHRTVMSNLMLAASRVTKDPKLAKDKVVESLNEFNLVDKANLYPAELSGGQRQRVAILQQMLCSQHFLLMDEPFSGLDMISIEKVGQLIQKVANLHDLNTIIICTHDITSAASVSDHLWMMGREKDQTGAYLPGARIVKTYDLIERGLCWTPGIITSPVFTNFVTEIKNEFRKL